MINLFVFLNNISKGKLEYFTQFVKKNKMKSANAGYTPMADPYLGGEC